MPWPYRLQCFDCDTQFPAQTTNYRREKCGGLLEVTFRVSRRKVPWTKTGLSAWRYRELLPVDNARLITTLAAGRTGLLLCPRLRRRLGPKTRMAKNDGVV